jgi:cation:H+ antiporter
MAFLAMKSSRTDPLQQDFNDEYAQVNMTTQQATLSFIIGLSALLIGSKALVWGAVGIATLFGVSELIIGLTIVAIGTSLPELAASIISARKNEHDLAIGNILGSNVFNILFIVGVIALFKPMVIDDKLADFDFPIAIIAAAALPFFALDGRLLHLDNNLTRKDKAVRAGV